MYGTHVAGGSSILLTWALPLGGQVGVRTSHATCKLARAPPHRARAGGTRSALSSVRAYTAVPGGSDSRCVRARVLYAVLDMGCRNSCMFIAAILLQNAPDNANAVKNCTWIEDTDFSGGSYAPAGKVSCRTARDKQPPESYCRVDQNVCCVWGGTHRVPACPGRNAVPSARRTQNVTSLY